MKQSLSEFQPGDRGVVIQLSTDQVLSNRLREMGMLPGTEITLVRRTPLGDPLEIRLRGTSLSLRRSDAINIFVEKIS